MSALARWFLSQKWAVSGSDATPSKIIHDLRKSGFKVKIGHKKGNVWPKTSLIIYSQAIPAANPELREGRYRGIPCLSYAEALGFVTRLYTTVAVAGAHGKSTTTAMVAKILKDAGMDPTVIVGTKVPGFGRGSGGSNFRSGTGKAFVVEADEFKGSFLNLTPTHAIVTNIDREHLDYYKNLRNIKRAFLGFVGKVREGGTVVVNRDDKNVWSLRNKIERVARQHELQISWYSLHRTPRVATVLRTVLCVPGEHNLSNALAAYTLARSLRVPSRIILSALRDYRGVWRRFEYRGRLNGARVFDDYGHHPTEITATIAGAREAFSNSSIVCVFQPHQAARLKLLFREFTRAFDGADALMLLPLYRVAGRDPHLSSSCTSASLAQAIAARGAVPVRYIANSSLLRPVLKSLVQSVNGHHSPIIIMMGAGDIFELTGQLLKK